MVFEEIIEKYKSFSEVVAIANKKLSESFVVFIFPFEKSDS